jgi:hypothetical protein
LTHIDPTRSEDKAAEIRRLAKKLEMYLGDSFVSGEELETLVSKVSGRAWGFGIAPFTGICRLAFHHPAKDWGWVFQSLLRTGLSGHRNLVVSRRFPLPSFCPSPGHFRGMIVGTFWA